MVQTYEHGGISEQWVTWKLQDRETGRWEGRVIFRPDCPEELRTQVLATLQQETDDINREV